MLKSEVLLLKAKPPESAGLHQRQEMVVTASSTETTSKKQPIQHIEQTEKCSLWSSSSVRLRIVIALALALSIEGLMRSNINMAMVCMVNKTYLDEQAQAKALTPLVLQTALLPTPNVSLTKDAPPLSFVERISSSTVEAPMAQRKLHSSCGNLTRKASKINGDLNISKSEQGFIFTSYYVGSLFILLPGSYLIDSLGVRNVVFIGAVLNVVGTFATPFVARVLGSYVLVAVRFVMGCGQGILVPCMNVLIAHWFPMSEKSTAIAIATTGNQISVIVAMLLTAELCQFTWLGGWTLAFYSYGIMGVVLCVVWLCFVSDSPAQARKLREKELRFIQNGEHKFVGKINPNEVPWSKILGSFVVWSTALCSFAQSFMNVGIVVYLPSYYHRFLRMDISSNGLMSALPFVFQLLTKIAFASIADVLRSREILTHSAVAKLFNLIASVGSGICFLMLAFCDCSHQVLAVSLAVMAIGLSSGYIPGYNTSIVCIAPRYTSSVASFSRLLGNIASVASPYMLGFFGDREEWNLAFFAIGFVSISTGFLFQLCGSASIQEWAMHIPHHTTLTHSDAQKDDTIAFLAAAPVTT